jgi:hypothetical protein
MEEEKQTQQEPGPEEGVEGVEHFVFNADIQ